MPQISEIRRQNDDEDQDFSEERSNPSVLVRGRISTATTRPGDRPSSHHNRLSFLSIISLILEYDIPLVNLPRTQGISGSSYGLGSGVSSTVARHVSGSESIEICPAGTMVALKKYTLTSDDPDKIAASATTLHRLIWQELQIFCHPFLRSHENICRLLYVGWEDTNIRPVLALEMGSYGNDKPLLCPTPADLYHQGTLAKALQHIRSYDSPLRKSHLTADIAIGLAALHKCGYVHGDIKTDNVIIQEHPTRTIVAKLADFSGSNPVATFGYESHHGFGTPMWQPPEVLFLDESIDWQRADVYSLGMVVATIWTTEGFIPEGGTFLDPETPYKFDPTAKNMWMGKKKTADDNSEHSVSSIAKRVTSCSGPTAVPVHSIISHTLSGCPKNRVDALTLLDLDVRAFLRQVGREVCLPTGDFESPMIYNDDTTYRAGVVQNPKYMERTPVFHKLALKTMVETANTTLERTQLPQLTDLGTPYVGREGSLIATLEDHDVEHQQLLKRSNLPMSFRILSTQIFLSYLCGCGTTINESEAAVWLYRAALAHDSTAIRWYCAIEDSLTKSSLARPSVPRRLWSAAAATRGFEMSAAYLERTDPDLRALTASVYRGLLWGRNDVQTVRFAKNWTEIKAWVRSAESHANSPLPVLSPEYDIQEKALHYCAAIGDLDFAKYLVTEAGADINALNLRNEAPIFYAARSAQPEMVIFLIDQGADVTQISTEGLGILHCLAHINDANAVDLLPLLLDRGASLTVKAPDTVEDYSNEFGHSPKLPVVWAAVRGREHLLRGFIEAHKRHRLDFIDIKELLELLARLHLGQMLEKTLSYLRYIVKPYSVANRGDCDIEKQFDSLSIGSVDTPRVSLHDADNAILDGELMFTLFELAVSTTAESSLQRRYLHGSLCHSARQLTIATLVKYGADLPGFESGVASSAVFLVQALRESVLVGDEFALPLCVEVYEQNGMDSDNFFAMPEVFSGCTALGLSIHRDAYQNFTFLLNRYPFLRDAVDCQKQGSLHLAASQESTRYTMLLLEQGADRYLWNEVGDTPFMMAVVLAPNLGNADLLAKDANMDLILGPDPVSGYTAFSRILTLMTTFKRNIGISRLRYLTDNYGQPCFYLGPGEKTTIFEFLLTRGTPYTDTEQLCREAIIFRYVTQLFQDKIDCLDSSGMAPLHWAAASANLDATRILLEEHANVNVLMASSEDSIAMEGLTPLALAIMMKQRGPYSHLKEGSEDVKLWQEKMSQVISLLCRYGGEVGPKADTATYMRAFIARNPNMRQMFSVMNEEGPPDIDDKSGHAVWPKRLPWEVELLEMDKIWRDGLVEIIAGNGLSKFTSAEDFKVTQVLLGAVNPGIRRGNMAPQLKEPPREFLDQLQVQWAQTKRDWLLRERS